MLFLRPRRRSPGLLVDVRRELRSDLVGPVHRHEVLPVKVDLKTWDDERVTRQLLVELDELLERFERGSALGSYRILDIVAERINALYAAGGPR